MASIRIERVNSELEKWISYIIRDMGNSIISNSFISVSYVDCASDLKSCRVGISFLGNEKVDRKKIIKALMDSKGFIKKRLTNYIKIKTIPDILFVEDNTEEKAKHIDDLLKGIKYSDDGDVDGE